ncbi:hypothetical protein KSP39_PZI011435 [Platanthera zijinensis]|uniref:Glucan endo-1,3-beta-D-glucosidase n=1 Tax=Platanthera zijinensis TaxID=2320716 RepID=A0AAP0BGJ9_9ASPA
MERGCSSLHLLLHHPFFVAAAISLLFSAFPITTAAAAGSGQGLMGVNYGMKGDNLPTPPEVISLCNSRNITKVRLFDPNAAALAALQNSGIRVILGSYNEDLPNFAADPSSAIAWVDANVVPYAAAVNFTYIDIGNEVIPGELAAFVLPAMRNIDAALRSAGISIPVTTTVSTAVLGTSYPPSQGAFTEEASQVMGPIVSFLASTNAPLLANVYPYFAYAGNPDEIRLDYALFNTSDIVVQDGSLGYSNLFDAMVDSVNSAIERLGGAGVRVVVSETGWPSAGGGNASTFDNARVYNNNLIRHVNEKIGTPKCPGNDLEVYTFALFNENLKPEGTERNFGMFYPDMTEVYHVDF